MRELKANKGIYGKSSIKDKGKIRKKTKIDRNQLGSTK
jgi:hypothetical protein